MNLELFRRALERMRTSLGALVRWSSYDGRERGDARPWIRHLDTLLRMDCAAEEQACESADIAGIAAPALGHRGDAIGAESVWSLRGRGTLLVLGATP